LLTAGHARCLVNVHDNIKLAKIIVNKNLSVRQAEFLVKKEQAFGSLKKFKSKNKDTNIKSLENDLELLMGIKVDIKNKKKNSGEIKFSYKNLDQLNKIISVLKRYFR
jgi:ParB family chromosome partitioning protein